MRRPPLRSNAQYIRHIAATGQKLAENSVIQLINGASHMPALSRKS